MNIDALKTLRNRVRQTVTEDGIYLVYRSRYRESAEDVARLVRSLGGVADMRKTGKMRTGYDRPWRVDFTVGIDADLYLAGRVGLSFVKEAL